MDNIEEIKHLFVPVGERLPKEEDNYYTLSERGIMTNRFFNGKRFEIAYYDGEIIGWMDWSLITTKKRALELAEKMVEESKQDIRDYLIGEGYDILSEHI